MKRIILILIGFLFALGVKGQSLTLLDCYDAARNHSPYVNQIPNLNQINTLRVKSLNKNKLPHVMINGQYTYQSEVVSLPDVPMVAFPEIPKNQYRLSLDVNQTIFGGNRISKTIAVENEKLLLDQQEIQLKLSSLKQTVNELYFSALTLQESGKVYDVILRDLNSRMDQVKSLVRNGVLRPADEKSLLIEIRKANQEKASIEFQKSAVLSMLSEKTGLEISEDVDLRIPQLDINPDSEINRGEKKVLNLTRNVIESQKTLSSLSRYPNLSAFASAGIGEPNPMNFFETGTSPFYIIGLKLSWKIWDWNDAKRSKEILQLQQLNLFEEEKNFDQNINTQIAGENVNLQKLKELLETDQEILALQSEITNEAFARYKQGVITSSAYSTELNKQIQARLKLAIREIEISKTIVNILTIKGNI